MGVSVILSGAQELVSQGGILSVQTPDASRCASVGGSFFSALRGNPHQQGLNTGLSSITTVPMYKVWHARCFTITHRNMACQFTLYQFSFHLHVWFYMKYIYIKKFRIF